MAKKPDANDAPSGKAKQEACVELATFINALDIGTVCAWRELIPIRKRLNGPGWVKKSDLQAIYNWALKEVFREPMCTYIIKRFQP